MSDQGYRATAELAWDLVEANRLDEARALFAELCALDEHDSESWMMLGTLHSSFEDYEEAVRCLEKAIALNSHYADAHLNLANVRVKQNQLESALIHCQVAIKSDTHYADAWQLLGAIQGLRGNTIESIASNRRAVELDPDNPATHASLGFALFRGNKLPDAVMSYERALELNPRMLDALRQFASINSQLNLNADAERCYRTIIGIVPTHADAYVKLGVALTRQGKSDVAIEMLRQGLRLIPNDVTLHLQLGVELQSKQRRKEALLCFQAAAELDRNSVVACIGMGSILEEQGRQEAALGHYQEALRLDPDNVQLRFHIARLEGKAAPETAPTDYVRRLFDDYAERFDSHLVGELNYRAPNWLYEAVTRALGPQRGKLDVLDLGCGTGLCGTLFRGLASRMTGVDLSQKMVEVARTRNLYDALTVGDITEVLNGASAKHDLIIAADVFIYVGELKQIFGGCQLALRGGGLFAFTIEALEEKPQPYVLQSTGRYAHAAYYVRNLAREYGLEEISVNPVVLRMEKGKPTAGYVVVLRRSDGN